MVREAGGDRSAVTGGTTVLSDWIVVKVSSEPGQSFLDKMMRDGRGRRAQEDPQRDRPGDLPGGPLHRLHPGHAGPVLLLLLLGRP